MTPETKLARMLGDTETEKLAHAFEHLSVEELEAILQDEEPQKTAAELIDPGWSDAQSGMMNAVRAGDSGLNQFLANDQLVGQRLKRGLGYGLAGAAGGAGLGALAGGRMGAGIGALAGGILGNGYGQGSADMDYLEERGVYPKAWGLTGARFTPEAARKYLPGSAAKSKRAGVEKTAFFGGDDLLGGAVGYNYGKAQKERGEDYRFGGKQVASLLLPGGAGYQVGRGIAHARDGIKKGKKKKQAHVFNPDSAAWADTLGRELAEATFQKEAISAIGTGLIGKGVGKAMGALTTSSGVKRGLVGAGVGAAGGALKDPGVDPATGQQKSRLGNMAIGAGLGAGLGVASKGLATSLGSMNNGVGRFVNGAHLQSASQSGNIASYRAARAMQTERLAKARAARNMAGAGGAQAGTTAPAAVAPAAPKALVDPGAEATSAAAASSQGFFQRAGGALQNAWERTKQVATTPLKFQSPIARAG